MGQQIFETCLSAAELDEKQSVLEQMTKNNLESNVRKFSSVEKNGYSCTIENFGIESEYHIVNDSLSLFPGYDLLAHKASISPELLSCTAERKTAVEDLLEPGIGHSAVIDHWRDLTDTLRDSAQEQALDILHLSVHPSFCPLQAKEMVSSASNRYQSLIDNIDARGHNRFSLPLVNRQNRESRGLIWEGSSASIQVNIKVPTYYLAAYYDTMSLLQPLLLATSASSPMIQNHLTAVDSVRASILPHTVYDVSPKERKQKQGRMHAFPFPLSEKQDETWKQFIDTQVYNRLRNEGVYEPIAAYVAVEALYDTVLVTEQDLENNVIGNPQTWFLNGKVKYDTLKEPDNIILEMRAMEPMETTEQNAALTSVAVAFQETLVDDFYEGTTGALYGDKIQYNIEQAAQQNARDRSLFWNTRGIVMQRPLNDIFREYAPKVYDKLLSYDNHPGDIPAIMNPVFGTMGIFTDYTNGRAKIYTDTPRPTVAERFREDITQAQPNIVKTAYAHDDVLREVLQNYLT